MDELIVKSEVEPLPYGFPPRERPIQIYLKYGIINLDKPRGPTSHTVTKWVREILGFKGKVGHSGTLEPHSGAGRSQGKWGTPNTPGEIY